MKLRVPFYYDEFRCITSKCRDNCCVGGWEIDIDDEQYEYYMQLEGELGEAIRASITANEDGEHCFKLNDGRCMLLTEDGLCRIHGELGDKHLSVVCDQFPRYSEYYGDFKESGIGLACEEAARIILSEDKHFCMVEKDCDEESVEDSEYDDAFAQNIFAAREKVFAILDRDDLSLNEKLIVILKFADEMQIFINSGNEEELEKCIADFEEESVEKFLEDMNEREETGDMDDTDIAEALEDILRSYEDMEILSDKWQQMLDDMGSILHEGMTSEEYQGYLDEYMTDMMDREYEYRNFITYLVFRYFAKTIYDYDAIGKAKMIVANYLVLRQMDMLVWYRNHKRFSYVDRLKNACIFSRQVEYSEDNIELLYESFLFDLVFETDNLCKLLWIDSMDL